MDFRGDLLFESEIEFFVVLWRHYIVPPFSGFYENCGFEVVPACRLLEQK